MKARALLGALALSLAACAPNRSTVEPPAELKDLPNAVAVTRLWSASLKGDAESLRLGLQPASDGQRVYAASRGGEVAAWDLATGRRAWRTIPDRLTRGSTESLGLWRLMTFQLGKLSGQRLAAGPSVADGIVVVGSSDGEVTALAAEDGKQLWSTVVGGEVIAPPAIGRGLVVVRTVSGALYALEATDGRVRWQAEQPVPSLTVRGTGAPVHDGARIYAGFDNGKIAAYEPARGTQLWEAQLSLPSGRSDIDRLADVDGVLSVSRDELVAAGLHGRIALIAADSGRALWQRDFSTHVGVTADADAVYATDADSLVWAFDRRDGGTLWTQDDLRARMLSAPTEIGTAVAVGDLEGWVHLLDRATGNLVGRVRAGDGPISMPPLAVGDVLVVQDGAGALTAFRVGTDG
jgi:outer membrane protein assembly factor BamB